MEVVTWRLIDSSLSHGQRPMYDVTQYVQEAGICKIKTSSETKKIQMFVIGKDCNKFRGERLRLGKGGWSFCLVLLNVFTILSDTISSLFLFFAIFLLFLFFFFFFFFFFFVFFFFLFLFLLLFILLFPLLFPIPSPSERPPRPSE